KQINSLPPATPTEQNLGEWIHPDRPGDLSCPSASRRHAPIITSNQSLTGFRGFGTLFATHPARAGATPTACVKTEDIAMLTPIHAVAGRPLLSRLLAAT